MSRPIPFTKASLKRAIKGAREAGLHVAGIRQDGTLIVHDGDRPPHDLANGPPPPSKWEDVKA